jgi:hypothetical protein
MNFLVFAFTFTLLSCTAYAHKYKSGECPDIAPSASFEMKKVMVNPKKYSAL